MADETTKREAPEAPEGEREDAAPEEPRAEKAYDKNREGARWINRKPSGPEFAEWFKDNVKIHEGLDRDDYIGGIVLIPAVETVQVVRGINEQTGEAIIEKMKQLTYTPYPKVETRVQYLWDLLDHRDGWYGVVEPIETDRPSTEPVPIEEQIYDGDRIVERKREAVPQIVQTVEQLPPGFFVMSVPVDGQVAHYLCASYKVEIRERESDHVVRSGRGTKMVALTNTRTWNNKTTIRADDNSIMKAETGAIGRAVALAGIFNIPGSGVATAEDMIEALAGSSAAAQAAEAAPPEQAGPASPAEEPKRERSKEERAVEEHQALLNRAKALVGDAHENYPGVLEAFSEWGKQRRPPVTNLGTLKGAALRGAVKKLEKLIEAAQKAQAERGEEPVSQDGDTDATPESPAESGENDGENSGADPAEPPMSQGGDTDATPEPG